MRKVPEHVARKVMAAADLIAERGLDDTKTEDIAAATGIPKATLYYYFAGKEEILGFLFEAVLAEVHTAVADAVAGPGSAAERLRAVIRAHLDVFVAHPGASRALQFDLGRAARIGDIGARSNAAFIEPVAALLRAGVKDKSLRRVAHPHLTAIALLGAVTTIGTNIVAMDPTAVPVSVLADTVATLAYDGLAPRRPA